MIGSLLWLIRSAAIQVVIDGTEPGLPVRQVWERLLDEHDAGISYASVRDYVTRLRAGTPGQRT